MVGPYVCGRFKPFYCRHLDLIRVRMRVCMPLVQTPTTPEEAAVLLDIAKRHLRLETLDERRMDSLDFHEHGVLSIRDALEAAYRAGQASKAR